MVADGSGRRRRKFNQGNKKCFGLRFCTTWRRGGHLPMQNSEMGATKNSLHLGIWLLIVACWRGWMYTHHRKRLYRPLKMGGGFISASETPHINHYKIYIYHISHLKPINIIFSLTSLKFTTSIYTTKHKKGFFRPLFCHTQASIFTWGSSKKMRSQQMQGGRRFAFQYNGPYLDIQSFF